MNRPLRQKLDDKLKRIRRHNLLAAVRIFPSSNFLLRKANKKLSYSQCGEDIIISHILESRHIRNASYLDIGAHHPYYLSNTAMLYSQGSRGVNVEPDPTLFKQFLNSRKRDINLNIGISDAKGKLKFYVLNPPTLNTFSRTEALKYKKAGHRVVEEMDIQVDTVGTIVKKYFKGVGPDILFVDIEGLDYLVLKTIDFKKIRPLVVCVETISYTVDDTGEKDSKILDLMKRSGYRQYADTRINTIFVRDDE